MGDGEMSCERCGRGVTCAAMGLPQQQKRYTPAEYYAHERQATHKSDYYDGEIFAMAGGTDEHSAIIGNIIVAVGFRLRGSDCAIRESNLRLKVQATGLRTYPDAAVHCGAAQFDEEDSEHQTRLNPTVIFEVLSKSTEALDRGFKFEHYRQITSLKSYVLVSQWTAHVEVFERQGDGSWLLRDARGLEASAVIPGIAIELPLAEVYDRVQFPPRVALSEQ
jgi:Uma2 family endonuclease